MGRWAWCALMVLAAFPGGVLLAWVFVWVLHAASYLPWPGQVPGC